MVGVYDFAAETSALAANPARNAALSANGRWQRQFTKDPRSEGTGQADGSRGCLNLAATVSGPCLGVRRIGPTRLIRRSEACEDENSPSGAWHEKTPMSLWRVRASSGGFYGGFKLGRLANNNRKAALQ